MITIITFITLLITVLKRANRRFCSLITIITLLRARVTCASNYIRETPYTTHMRARTYNLTVINVIMNNIIYLSVITTVIIRNKSLKSVIKPEGGFL